MSVYAHSLISRYNFKHQFVCKILIFFKEIELLVVISLNYLKNRNDHISTSLNNNNNAHIFVSIFSNNYFQHIRILCAL